MKVICNGLELADALQKVAKAIPQKKGIPILEGIKMSAITNRLTLSATDTAFAIVKDIKADVMIEGDVVVPGKFLAEFVRKLASENQIELDLVDGNILKVKYMDSEVNMQCMDVNEFPPINELQPDVIVGMTQAELKDIVNKIIFSASTEEIRPILKGVLFSLDGDVLTGVALDGYRLAVAKKQLDRDYEKRDIVIPAKNLFEIAKLIEDNDDPVRLIVNDKKMMIDLDHTRVITVLLEGDFISYDKIIPKEFGTKVTVDKEQLASTLDRVSLISRISKNNLIKLDFREKVVTVSADATISKVEENVAISLNGKDITIGCNDRYIADCLKVIDDEFIRIQMNSSVTPCVITPLEGDEYLYLILPIRVME